MEIMTMGKVIVSARIENLQDAYDVEKGVLPAGELRTVEVSDALVDTGATLLSIPRRLIVQLGLTRRRTEPPAPQPASSPSASMEGFA